MLTPALATMFKHLPLLSLLFCSCAELPKPVQLIDPNTVKYIQMFEAEYNVKVTGSVLLGDLPGDIVGTCQRGRNTNTITFDPSYFFNTTEDGREELAMHEFFHCYFDLHHDNVFITVGPMAGCPRTVMQPYLSLAGSGCWAKFKSYYLSQPRWITL
jgi:hypothetical protein